MAFFYSSIRAIGSANSELDVVNRTSLALCWYQIGRPFCQHFLYLYTVRGSPKWTYLLSWFEQVLV